MNADCDIKMTEKEIENLKAWKRWRAMMKMLKAIHREIEPNRMFLQQALR
jgi:hypothetical protein